MRRLKSILKRTKVSSKKIEESLLEDRYSIKNVSNKKKRRVLYSIQMKRRVLIVFIIVALMLIIKFIIVIVLILLLVTILLIMTRSFKIFLIYHLLTQSNQFTILFLPKFNDLFVTRQLKSKNC